MKLRSMIPVLAMVMVPATCALAAEGEDVERAARWKDLSQSVFGDVPIQATESVISLDAPTRAEDASLVPLTIRAADSGIVGADLIIDDNPSPVAARVRFGPAGDAREMKLRVRIDGYTNVHVVAQTGTGQILQNTRFVKASGGCSAPSGASDEEAMRGIGEMRMKFDASSSFGGAPEATLMIRHPNFNGMQMDQLKRTYTPARYIDTIAVTRGEDTVFTMTTDISLSVNPVISFLYKPETDKPFHVVVTDTEGGRWAQDFDAPRATN